MSDGVNGSERLARLRALMAERALDAVLITHPSNRFYLSGYTDDDVPPNESGGVLLIDRAAATLLTSANNVEWARSEAIGFETVAWTRPWSGTVAEWITARGWRRVGFEDGAILYATHRDLTAALNGTTDLVPLGDAIDRLREGKDAVELAALTAAIHLTDDAFVAATIDLSAGTTERALARRIERELRERGAEALAFPPIVAAGPHGARPHHLPSDRPIVPGEPVVIDMGGRLRGYNADLTRTIWVGEPEPRLRELYPLVLRAQQTAIAAMRAGITGKEADAAAREVIAAAGYGEAFTHGLGHGLGIRVHEGPNAAMWAEEPLPAGAVITIEPGIYLPGWGGVRIEDVGVVEPGGCRILTTAPKAALS